jgi:cytochrome c oxidase subunit II
VRNRPLLQMIVFGVIGCAILFPIAFLIPWFPTEGSRQAGNIHTLYYVLLIASIPIFVLVETVVVFSVWRFRARPGDGRVDGPPIHGNTRLEVVWTVLPALLILGLVSYAYGVLRSDEATKRGEMTVNVTARQFAFEFSYLNSSGKPVVASALYVPKGQPVVFKLRSLDVIHSFFVPEFSEKLDAVPGITTTLRATPTRIGTYPVECTELCGPGHAFMRSTVHVVSQAQFRSWLASQSSSTAPPIGQPGAKSEQPGVPGATGGGASAGTRPGGS